MSYKQLPKPDVLLELEPEEIGVLVLSTLYGDKTESAYNYCLGTSEEFARYADGFSREAVQKALMEGWTWLINEGLVARQPGETSERYFITRRGLKLKKSGNLKEYLETRTLAQDLDPILEADVKPLFLRGNLDAAVFQAYREVEIRMRSAASLGNDIYGQALVTKCFHPESGTLVDINQEPAEREALYLLLRGAIGLYKNPQSHRNVESTVREASVLINFADYLIKLVEGRTVISQ